MNMGEEFRRKKRSGVRRGASMSWLEEAGRKIMEKIEDLCGKTGSETGRKILEKCTWTSAQDSAYDRRKNPRYRDGRTIFCIPKSGLPFNAMVLDSSLGGLRIKSRERLEVNSVIGIIPNCRGTADQFLAKVMWETKRRGLIEYGVQFKRGSVNDLSTIGKFINPVRMKLQGA